jgi:hypothetical protein
MFLPVGKFFRPTAIFGEQHKQLEFPEVILMKYFPSLICYQVKIKTITDDI